MTFIALDLGTSNSAVADRKRREAAETCNHAGHGQTGASGARPQGRVVDADYHDTPQRS